MLEFVQMFSSTMVILVIEAPLKFELFYLW